MIRTFTFLLALVTAISMPRHTRAAEAERWPAGRRFSGEQAGV